MLTPHSLSTESPDSSVLKQSSVLSVVENGAGIHPICGKVEMEIDGMETSIFDERMDHPFGMTMLLVIWLAMMDVL